MSRLMVDLSYSTCNFLAVDAIRERLESHGFSPLNEADAWNLERNGKYYVEKNGTAIFAFILGSAPIEEEGVRIVSSHSDSPGFKLKPNCEIYGDGGVVSLNVEKYGGPIMYTWFDRPLSLAGRVMITDHNGGDMRECIVDLEAPVATIPHLAIHFNRAVNEGNPLSVQRDMKPVIGYFSQEEIDNFKKAGGIIRTLLANHINEGVEEDAVVLPEDILDYELSLYPVQDPCFVGIHQEYFQSGRIDDLSMAFASVEALISEADTSTPYTRIVAVFDNEETGSGTKQGAASPVLRHIIERICVLTSDDKEAFYRTLANSFMISADDAHAWHPNYDAKYDPTNHPVMGGGPVVKINANCKYMTDAHGAAVFHSLCNAAGVNMQYFVNHADVAGGSTLGNISSSQLDIPGVDVGCAIWAMHSCAETASVSDHLDMVKVLREFL